MIDAAIGRTIQSLRSCMFDFSSMAGATGAACRGHRGGEEHNCDQNGQQFSRTSSNGLSWGDHVLEPSSSIQAHCRTVARVALTLIKSVGLVDMRLNADVSRLSALMLSIAALATPVFVAAAQSLPPEVAQRQQDMKAMAEAAKSINAMFKGSSPYDSKLFKAAAETIRSQSGTALSTLFEGSVTAAGSKASSNIETERQQFDKLALDLSSYAAALSVAADRNRDALGPGMRMQAGDAVAGGGPLAKRIDPARDAISMSAEHAFHLMLQTCTSCHAKFRVESK
ncbi:cytochrome c556 [Sinorhizobium fredii]